MKTSSLRISSLLALSSIVVTFFVSHIAFAQICKPVSQRTGEVGCWIMANTTSGIATEGTNLLASVYLFNTQGGGRGKRASRNRC